MAKRVVLFVVATVFVGVVANLWLTRDTGDVPQAASYNLVPLK